jgi:hypothetical protein
MGDSKMNKWKEELGRKENTEIEKKKEKENESNTYLMNERVR